PTGEPKSIPKREGSIFEQPLVAGLLVRAVLFQIPPFPKVIEWIVHPSFTPFLRQLFNQAIETVFTSLYGNISAFSFSVAVSGTLWHVLCPYPMPVLYFPHVVSHPIPSLSK